MESVRFTRSAAVATGGASNRRGLIVGAGIVGVAAVAARALRGQTAKAPPAANAKPPADHVGYEATPHVLRYYETAKF